MAKRVRWECPAGEHPGVLGSTRPLADATVRYCLPCSEAEGRLVKRVAPALERRRAAKTAVVAGRRKSKAEREREAKRAERVLVVREMDGGLGEVDVRRAVDKMMRLPALREFSERACPYRKLQPPEVTLRRSRSKNYTSGHTWYGTWAFTVTAAADPRRVEFEEVLLHELVHVVLPPAQGHGAMFRRTLVRAAREWWPGRVDGVTPDATPTTYGLDEAIVRAASGGTATRSRGAVE